MAIVAANGEPVPTTSPVPPPDRWREVLREAIRDPAELCRVLQLPPCWTEQAEAAAGQFPVFAPRGFVARMQPGDPQDPLLRQVLPLDLECRDQPGFTADPLQEQQAQAAPGVLHKYPGRALLVVTGACAVHCRYCFRRHFPYSEGPHSWDQWEPALQYLAQEPSIDEVLLSGGDPLTLPDDRLSQLIERLEAIPHLRRLRIHSRLPVVIPERVNLPLVQRLQGSRLTPWMVIHANHPAEIDATVAAAIERLIRCGIPVLNQAVLLRGVNDDLTTLVELSRRLINLRVMPYYLHQLDRVLGTAHFEVEPQRGAQLVARMQQQLPGYAVPRYVREVPGELHKVLIPLPPGGVQEGEV